MEWKVYSNQAMEPTPYHIARQIRNDEPLHGGNIEESDHGYFTSKETAQLVADEMNRREQND